MKSHNSFFSRKQLAARLVRALADSGRELLGAAGASNAADCKREKKGGCEATPDRTRGRLRSTSSFYYY